MSNQSPAIDLTDVSFQFPSGLVALQNVSLQVRHHEIVALVGPSGCGKSTLLNLVAGLREPSGGEIGTRGQVASSRLGRFSYMPQRDALMPWRTVLDNAAVLMEVRGEPKRAARDASLRMLRQFGLAEFATSLPSRLSGGMRQRVALIRTFLPDRDVLMDEPFGALDAITRSGLQEWLLHVHDAMDTSILFVTHDVEEALFLSDRVYLMSPRPGRIIWQCPVNLPRPRTVSLTATMEFAAMKGEILARLREAMREQEQAWAA